MTITDLGTLPGETRSEAYGISSNGLIVGSSHEQAFSNGRPVIWDRGIPRLLASGACGEARGVNPSGSAVGWDYCLGRAALWKNGVTTNVGVLPGGNSSWANAINPAGTIVGLSNTRQAPGGDFTAHAFMWKAGIMTDLGTLGGSESEAFAINPAGTIVGSSSVALPSRETHAFLWRHGTMTDLGTLHGGWNSQAFGINGRGQVVGTSTGDAAFHGHAVVWDRGAVIDLGTLPGRESSTATAIGPSGDIVGWSGEGPTTTGTHAFLWRHGVLTDLGTLPGEDYSIATGIDAAGAIVGIATAADGQWHAVKWTVR